MALKWIDENVTGLVLERRGVILDPSCSTPADEAQQQRLRCTGAGDRRDQTSRSRHSVLNDQQAFRQ